VSETTDPHEALSTEEVHELVRDLGRLRDHLEESLDSSADGDKPVDLDEPIGRLSRIDAIQQQEMRKSGRRLAERRLSLVRAALSRAASEDFGSCVECEEPIGYRRLKAKPESRMCVGCQSQRETQ